jgi:hypothetical protein
MNQLDVKENNRSIQEKYKQVDKFLLDRDLSHKKNLLMKQELHQLKVLDTHRNQETLRWQSEQKKLKILEKHMKIDSKIDHIKQGRAHMLEYSRIANELRVQKIME